MFRLCSILEIVTIFWIFVIINVLLQELINQIDVYSKNSKLNRTNG